MSLAERLLTSISDNGPLPFEEFQHRALYDPDYGFFSGAILRSTKAGDFLTSPEVSELFGATIAAFVSDALAKLDTNCPTLIEAGAGSGSLLGPLLSELDPPVAAWAVEASPAARTALEALIPGRVVASWDSLPLPIDGVIVANELLDNLPVALARRKGNGWVEQHVGINGGRMVLVPAPARPEVAEWAERFGVGTPDGGVVEVQLEAGRWIRRALASIRSGSLVVIDYGDTAEGLAPRRGHGTLRTYRSHHLGPDPLHSPGETDITVDVNFTAAEAAACEAGAAEVTVDRQDTFLAAWGLRERLSALRQEELQLARDGDPMERLQVRSRRTEVETLMHPRGLGDFRVLVATKSGTIDEGSTSEVP